MAAQILDQVDETANSLMESISEVQTNIYELYSTVGDLLNSMSEMLKSMTEMKETLHQPTTESQVPVDLDNLHESSEKQSISVDNSIEEKMVQIEMPVSQGPVDQNLPETPEKQTIVVDFSIEEKIYLKKVQIEMPVFEGLNVFLWISRAERYFEIGNFTETEKLRLVYTSVDGEALNWYNFWKLRKPFVNWNDLKTRLLNRFGEDLKSGSAIDRILGLKQDGSVIVYLSQFEELASQLSDSDGANYVLEAVFCSGLKEEIKNTIRMFQVSGQVKDFNDVITMALRLENSSVCRSFDYSSSSETDIINK